MNCQELNQQIQTLKWSDELKSKGITIDGNVVTVTKQMGYSQFCLLDTPFSNTIKQNQSWAIQIISGRWGVDLGICLRSKMIDQNFFAKNLNWQEIGHKFYLIGSSGNCWSHSQKELNFVKKSFQFEDGDVILIEYDPIEWKLRFIKNDDEYFQMSIIPPPQNDAYYPCVALDGQNDQVQLILQQQEEKNQQII